MPEGRLCGKEAPLTWHAERKMRHFADVPFGTFTRIDVGKIKTDIRGANAIKDGIEAPF